MGDQSLDSVHVALERCQMQWRELVLRCARINPSLDLFWC